MPYSSSHLPESIRDMLSRNPPYNIVKLAKATDDILAAQTEPLYSATVDAVKHNSHQHQKTHSQNKHNRCFYHYNLGKKARKCGYTASTPCDISHLIAPILWITVRKHKLYLTLHPATPISGVG